MNMANGNSKVLTAEQEMQIRRPIEEYVGAIQKQIDGLRVDGTDKVLSLQNTMDGVKRGRTLTKGEKRIDLRECAGNCSRQKR